MKEEDIYKMSVAPEAVRDMVIFAGDGFIGEVWSRVAVEEDGVKMWMIQFEPERTLFNIVNQAKNRHNIIDNKTGRTITRRYDSAKVQIIGNNPWARRILVYSDWMGNDMDIHNIQKSILEENNRLRQEVRGLRNELGYVYTELRTSQSQQDQNIKVWANRMSEIGRARGHLAYDPAQRDLDSNV